MPALDIDYEYWALQAAAMVLTAFFIPKLKITSPFGPILAVIFLAFVNSAIWDAALFFEIPNSWTSRALVLLVANGVIFWITVKLLPGIEIHGFLPALVAPIVFTLCNVLVVEVGNDVDWSWVFQQALEYISKLRAFLKTIPISSGLST